jgi:hypothetical protein
VELETLNKYSKAVKVKEKLPASLKGKELDVIFIINDGNVDIEFKKF